MIWSRLWGKSRSRWMGKQVLDTMTLFQAKDLDLVTMIRSPAIKQSSNPRQLYHETTNPRLEVDGNPRTTIPWPYFHQSKDWFEISYHHSSSIGELVLYTMIPMRMRGQKSIGKLVLYTMTLWKTKDWLITHDSKSMGIQIAFIWVPCEGRIWFDWRTCPIYEDPIAFPSKDFFRYHDLDSALTFPPSFSSSPLSLTVSEEMDDNEEIERKDSLSISSERDDNQRLWKFQATKDSGFAPLEGKEKLFLSLWLDSFHCLMDDSFCSLSDLLVENRRQPKTLEFLRTFDYLSLLSLLPSSSIKPVFCLWSVAREGSSLVCELRESMHTGDSLLYVIPNAIFSRIWETLVYLADDSS